MYYGVMNLYELCKNHEFCMNYDMIYEI